MHAWLFAFLLCCSAQNLNPIVVGGNMMWDVITGERFYVKGVTYGYDVSDTFESDWAPALDLIAATGANAIRVYNVNPSVHAPPFSVTNSFEKFMAALAAKKMYAIIAVTPPGSDPWTACTLNRDGTPPLGPDTCYPSCLLTYGQAVINQFSKYTNTLAFVVGNEVLDSPTGWKAAPCLKAYVRDLKMFMNSCSNHMRLVPLLYAAADTDYPSLLTANQNDYEKGAYLLCGGDPDARIDIYGLNVYRWCSTDCTFASCYEDLYNSLARLPIPLWLSEFGCENFYWYPKTLNKKGQRDWKQVSALYSTNMTKSLSGGFAYSYGVSGGDGFALFTGGGRGPSDSPGYTKVCGYPNNMCNVNNLTYQYGLADPIDSEKEGANLCVWKPPGYSFTAPPCPTIPGVDITLPETRQGAAGYASVGCPVRSLTPIETAIKNCDTDPPSPDEPPYDGLSPGSIAGISIGGVFVVGAAASVAYYYFVRRPQLTVNDYYRA